MASNPTPVYIGKKPLRMYIGKAQSVFGTEGKVVIAARGNLIPRAIVVADKIRGSRFTNTFIGCERIVGEDGRPRDVPRISIELVAATVTFPVIRVTEGTIIPIDTIATISEGRGLISHDGITHPY